ALLRPLGRGEADARSAPALHRRRAKDGADGGRALLALPAGAAEREGHRRGDRLASLAGDRGSGEPSARAEGRDGQPDQRVLRRASRAMAIPEVVLAFSGGLDTSFCVPYLKEQGYRVVTLFVDTGGASAEERAYIEQRAIELGAAEHVTVDGGQSIWANVVVPLV